MNEVGEPHQQYEVEPTVMDVSRIPLADLLRTDNALDNAMRRVLRDMDHPGDNYAAHSSTP